MTSRQVFVALAWATVALVYVATTLLGAWAYLRHDGRARERDTPKRPDTT